MATSVIIPWRGGCPHRETALRWVLDRYADQHPTWQVTVGTHTQGDWCKAAAVADALRHADGDLLVIADADVWCDGLTEATRHPVAVPHDRVHRLTQESTVRYTSGQRGPYELEHAPYRGVRGGGILVITRDAYQATPLDPRFRGWGQEDESWWLAVKTIHGEGWRGTADLWHLWHPAQPRDGRHKGSRDGFDLYLRYRRATHDKAAMRRLIEEGQRVDRLRSLPVPHPAS